MIKKLTLAGGLVRGLSSTTSSIREAIFIISTGRVLILLALRSSLARFKYVISRGTHKRRLLRRTKDLRDRNSPIRGGRWVNWLPETSNSVKCDMRPNSSGRFPNLLFDTNRIYKADIPIRF